MRNCPKLNSTWKARHPTIEKCRETSNKLTSDKDFRKFSLSQWTVDRRHI
jgi:hypothetical protein